MVLKINSVARGLKKGIHPLQMAIDRGNMDLVEALVNKGAEIDRQCYYPEGMLIMLFVMLLNVVNAVLPISYVVSI